MAIESGSLKITIIHIQIYEWGCLSLDQRPRLRGSRRVDEEHTAARGQGRGRVSGNPPQQTSVPGSAGTASQTIQP
jgi:hypothetical protein